MSQEKMDWVSQAAEAWNRGDHEAALALVQAHLAPSIQLAPLYLDRVYTGIGALRQVWADAIGTWQDYRSVVEEITRPGRPHARCGARHRTGAWRRRAGSTSGSSC